MELEPNQNCLVWVLVGFGKFVDLQNKLRSDVTDIANVGHDFMSDLMTPQSLTTTSDVIDTLITLHMSEVSNVKNSGK